MAKFLRKSPAFTREIIAELFYDLSDVILSQEPLSL